MNAQIADSNARGVGGIAQAAAAAPSYGTGNSTAHVGQLIAKMLQNQAGGNEE